MKASEGGMPGKLITAIAILNSGLDPFIMNASRKVAGQT